MHRCLELAETARERGEVPVSSVLVRDGSVIAEGVEGLRAQHDVAVTPRWTLFGGHARFCKRVICQDPLFIQGPNPVSCAPTLGK